MSEPGATAVAARVSHVATVPDSLPHSTTHSDRISYATVHVKVQRARAQLEQQQAEAEAEAGGQAGRGSGHSPGFSYGIAGLMNLGNTCYMNTAIQCLASTPPLVEYFQGFPWRDELNRENPIGAGGKIAEDFGQLIAEMWATSSDNSASKGASKKGKIITPTAFKKTLGSFHCQFQTTQQQDVQELLAFMLDGLHEDLNRVVVKPYVPEVESDGKLDSEHEVAVASWRGYLLRNRSIVVDIFQGQLRNVLKCLTCNHKSLKFDPYMYMSVPCNPQTSTLKHCLAEFCKPEVLSSDCQWRCPKCKEPRDAEKKMDLWIVPPIFIVHLKRFQQNEKGKRSKIDSLIDFPLENLDLSEFVGKSGSTHLYNLYGVANHHGSLARGHYTAFVRHERSGQWYKFNDTKINKISEREVVTKSAYVLFYSKVCKQDTPPTSDTTGFERPDQGRQMASPEQPMKMLTVDMIRRQSITIPQLWPHNVSSAITPNSMDIFPEQDEEDEVKFEDMPCPSFFNTTSPQSEPVKPKRKYVKIKPASEITATYLDRKSRRRVKPDRYF